jgi:hypothetical protein
VDLISLAFRRPVGLVTTNRLKTQASEDQRVFSITFLQFWPPSSYGVASRFQAAP